MAYSYVDPNCPYMQFYLKQAGGGVDLPYFAGFPGQKGHGIGSFFSGLARFVFPFLKQSAKYVGKRAMSTGTKIISDVLQGQDLQTAANKRMTETVDEMQAQEGSGRKRGRKPTVKKTASKKKKTPVKRRKLTRTVRDIFAP